MKKFNKYNIENATPLIVPLIVADIHESTFEIKVDNKFIPFNNYLYSLGFDSELEYNEWIKQFNKK